MSFTGFIISILVMCFIAFFICMGAVIIAIKIKIKRRGSIIRMYTILLRV